MLGNDFFNKEPEDLAIALLGKVLRRRINHSNLGKLWLAARIIETEAYYLTEKGSHSSLGFTQSRKAMFMKPGTIYMYYARGGDSLNFSASGKGNGVLIKSAFPYIDKKSPQSTIGVMQELNPGRQSLREQKKLCNGQTLLCKSLDLKVPDWNQKQLNRSAFRVDDVNQLPKSIVQCRRLGIPAGRDSHLMLRYVDNDYAHCCTSNPLTRRNWQRGKDYLILNPED